jgi:hypothetical protein
MAEYRIQMVRAYRKQSRKKTLLFEIGQNYSVVGLLYLCLITEDGLPGKVVERSDAGPVLELLSKC